MLQSLQKFLVADPEILVCVILGQNWDKIVPMPKRGFFENFIYVTFVYLIFPIMLQSFRKSFRADPEILAYVIFWAKLGQNYPFSSKRCFWNFYLCEFCLLNKPYYAAKFQKIFSEDSEILAW